MNDIRLILGVRAGDVGARICEVMANLPGVNLVQASTDLHQFIRACQQGHPDVVVLDTSISDLPPQEALMQAGGGRQLPALLIADDGQVDGYTTLAPRTVADGSEFDRTSLRARVHLLASQGGGDARRTRARNDLDLAMAEARRLAAGSRNKREFLPLAEQPLDLVLLTGPEESAWLLLDLVTRFTFVPVPIVIAIEESDELQGSLEGVAQVPVRRLSNVLSTRAMDGLVFVHPAFPARVDGEVLTPDPMSSREGLIDSMFELGARGLVVFLDPANDPAVRSVARLRNAQVHVLPHGLGAPGAAAPALPDRDELARMLGRLVARRA